MVPEFKEGGKYRVFYDYADQYALARPVTPAYPYISSVFQKAHADIMAGGDAQKILDQAVSDIDTNIKQNGGYEY